MTRDASPHPIHRLGETTKPPEATQSRIAVATRSGGAYVFRAVAVVPPGTGRTRTFRITDVGANAAGVGISSSLIPSTIVAVISASAPLRIPLTGAQQNVAVLGRNQ